VRKRRERKRDEKARRVNTIKRDRRTAMTITGVKSGNPKDLSPCHLIILFVQGFKIQLEGCWWRGFSLKRAPNQFRKVPEAIRGL
jgi:hypothetical protein